MEYPTAVRNAISPLLDELIRQLAEQGLHTQKAYFARILNDLDSAQDELALLTPIQALSTYRAVGFKLSSDVEPLLQRIVEKTAVVADQLDSPGITWH